MLRDRLFAIQPAALLIAPVLVMVFTLAQAAVARFMGGAVAHIALGVGPTLATMGTVQLRALPIGAHIQFTPDDTPTDQIRYEALSVAQKITLQLSGPAALALLTAPLQALHDDLGLICAALLVVNLLPMPGTAGGQALIALLEAARGAPLSDRARLAWMLVSLVAVWGGIGWLLLA